MKSYDGWDSQEYTIIDHLVEEWITDSFEAKKLKELCFAKKPIRDADWLIEYVDDYPTQLAALKHISDLKWRSSDKWVWISINLNKIYITE